MNIGSIVAGIGSVAGIIVSVVSSDTVVRSIAGGAAVVCLGVALWFARGLVAKS